uniref:Retrotransposon protein n=1 Tax=Cucumis melo TaxID=3656 RepID=A0A9I9EMG7_CUCME
MQSHPTAKGLLNKSFPYYDELAYAFGRDRAKGRFAETFTGISSIKPTRYEGFDMPDGNKAFSSMYSQGIDMSREDVCASRPSHASEGRTGSSESKRKREASKRVRLKSYIWPSSVRMTNSGRLRSGLHTPLPMTTMCTRNSYAYCVRCRN